MMRVPRAVVWTIAALLGLANVSCASPDEKAAYEAFLNQIARECKPLIIGTENIGQALTFNGVGSDPENYNNFLSKTSSLYYGIMPPDLYRKSLTSFLGSGNYNNRSFECIFAHLPKKPADH